MWEKVKFTFLNHFIKYLKHFWAEAVLMFVYFIAQYWYIIIIVDTVLTPQTNHPKLYLSMQMPGEKKQIYVQNQSKICQKQIKLWISPHFHLFFR